MLCLWVEKMEIDSGFSHNATAHFFIVSEEQKEELSHTAQWLLKSDSGRLKYQPEMDDNKLRLGLFLSAFSLFCSLFFPLHLLEEVTRLYEA